MQSFLPHPTEIIIYYDITGGLQYYHIYGHHFKNIIQAMFCEKEGSLCHINFVHSFGNKKIPTPPVLKIFCVAYRYECGCKVEINGDRSSGESVFSVPDLLCIKT